MSKIEILATQFIQKARKIYGQGFIPIHRPVFEGDEISLISDCLNSNFVSSSGEFVDRFEKCLGEFIGCDHVIATVNGTSALHVALLVAGVQAEDEVITQALTFVATCNAIHYIGAKPLFVDVDIDTMGMSPKSLRSFLEKNARKTKSGAYNRKTGNRISACVPMHTYGIPCRINELRDICDDWGIALVEDAAESLGSYHDGKHTGTFGLAGVFSFNGNKVITTGGGGAICTDDEKFARTAKHITTTAKKSDNVKFFHDVVGYNYRLPAICAALGVAQMAQLEKMLHIKLQLASYWQSFFYERGVSVCSQLEGDESNNWFIAINLNSLSERNEFLEITNKAGVMTRPFWTLMTSLPMYQQCQRTNLDNSFSLEQSVVAISSSVPHLNIDIDGLKR